MKGPAYMFELGNMQVRSTTAMAPSHEAFMFLISDFFWMFGAFNQSFVQASSTSTAAARLKVMWIWKLVSPSTLTPRLWNLVKLKISPPLIWVTIMVGSRDISRRSGPSRREKETVTRCSQSFPDPSIWFGLISCMGISTDWIPSLSLIYTWRTNLCRPSALPYQNGLTTSSSWWRQGTTSRFACVRQTTATLSYQPSSFALCRGMPFIPLLMLQWLWTISTETVSVHKDKNGTGS